MKMPVLNINFEDVPDEILPITPGTHVFEVTEVPVIEPTKDGLSQKLVVKMKIVDGPDAGRAITDYISVKMQTRMKRFFLALGLQVGAEGIDTNDALGRTGKLVSKTEAYTNPQTGETRESAKVVDYILPE
jgi:hypothetical protein